MSNEIETSLAQTAGEIADLLSARTRASHEGRVLSLVRLYQGQDLIDLLDLLDLGRLLNALDNRRWGPDSRKEFIRLLQPISDRISVTSKASMIRTLARKKMTVAEEQFLARMFMTESGEQLTRLKLDVDKATDGYDLVVLNGFSTLASYWTNLKPADSPVPVLVLSTNYHHVDMADTHTTAFAWTGQPSLESLTPITFTHMTSLNDTQWLGAGGTTYGPTLDSVLPTDATKVWHVDNTADRPLLWTLESGDDDEAGNPLSVKVAVLPFVQLWRSASSFDSDGDETVMEVIQWLMT